MEAPTLLRLSTAPDGSRLCLAGLSPEALPPVRGRDLDAAWDAARCAGPRRAPPWQVRFQREDGSVTDLRLDDPEASRWAWAAEAEAGLRGCYGLSVCLRLLALLALLAQAPDLSAYVRGGDLHPVLARAVATAPLTAEAGLDEAALRARLLPAGRPAA